MFKVRVIPCLDVKDGRAVKGVNFVNLRDAGDPVEAAIAENRERTIAEAADVLYHLLVVLHVRGIALDEVEAELAARTRQSGLDEKAARKSG